MAKNIYDEILRDAHVKLAEMFKDNFREQGFFGQKWVATKVSKTNKRGCGSILLLLLLMVIHGLFGYTKTAN